VNFVQTCLLLVSPKLNNHYTGAQTAIRDIFQHFVKTDPVTTNLHGRLDINWVCWNPSIIV